jgi:glucosamine--fructose-6-phosphate aminotransferase (isomerizing)
MCWIFAYQWHKDAVSILTHGLQRLEYRGYDSAGIVTFDGDGTPTLIRSVWKVSELCKKISQMTNNQSTHQILIQISGIAHTRWATHGGITELNTHPHHDTNNKFFVVHNGIIENQYKLKEELKKEWYHFYGETDTEVIPALLAKYRNGNLYDTVQKVLPLLHGAYALLIKSTYCPTEMIGVKRWSPLLFALHSENKDFFFSSDAQALAWYATQVVYLEDGEVLHLKDNEYNIISEKWIIQKSPIDLDISAMESSKGEYEHFMLKEIFEQPAIMRRIMMGRIDFVKKTLMAEAFHGMHHEQYETIIFIGCGTSYNAGLLGAYRIESLTGITAKAEIASEYLNKKITINPQTLYVFLSQSWETADTIEILKYIKAKGWKTFGIVNVVWSTIAQLTDHGLFMRAGYEIGVASTKAFIGQLTCLLLLALWLSKRRNIPLLLYNTLVDEMKNLPSKIEYILKTFINKNNKDLVLDRNAYTDHIKNAQTMFYLWRGWEYPIACEWSLKMKEISYIHAEAYPAWELKHGPLALIQDTVPSIMIAIDDEFLSQNISSISEIQARKGTVIAIANDIIPQAEYTIVIPRTHSFLAPFLVTIVMQLLSYHTAHGLNRNIDKPRNLAKSVTVK